MNNTSLPPQMPQSATPILFLSGLVVGSTVGIVLGSLLTFWWGLAALRAFRRTMRRIQNGDQPSRELLLQ